MVSLRPKTSRSGGLFNERYRGVFSFELKSTVYVVLKFYRKRTNAIHLALFVHYSDVLSTTHSSSTGVVSTTAEFFAKPFAVFCDQDNEFHENDALSHDTLAQYTKNFDNKMERSVSLANFLRHNPGLYEALKEGDLLHFSQPVNVKLSDLGETSARMIEDALTAAQKSVNGKFEY